MKLSWISLLTGFILFAVSCSSPQESETEFFIDGSLQVTMVADDSLLDSPVAFKEDSQGQFWVVEMPGYMRDIDGNDQDLADGRIVLLSDENADGILDNRKIVLDSLLNPRAVELVYGGVLFTDGNALKFANYSNERLGDIELVDSLYVVGGNIEHQPNGLLYGLDNWLYSAKSNVRYKKVDSIWLREVTSFRGQWGISQDEYGRLVYNHNSAPIIGDLTMPNYFLNNPFLKLKESIGNYYTDDMRLYPLQATSVNRGYQDGVLDSAGVLQNYTSACSPIVYYGHELKEAYGDIFVCAPEANLISKYEIDHSKQLASKLNGTEFLTTLDESFRPVALHSGNDGCLYVLDMHKGIIQHTAYMSSYLRQKILETGLDKINGQGRIFKIESNNNNKQGNRISKSITNNNSKDLLKLLSHKNMNLRLWAQKQLVHKKAESSELRKMVLANNNPLEFRHALWTLEGQQAIDGPLMNAIDFQDFSSNELIAVLPIFLRPHKHWVLDERQTFLTKIIPSSFGKDFRVDVLWASLLDSDNTKDWLTLAQLYPDSKLMVEALLSTVEDEKKYLELISPNNKLTLLKNSLLDVLKNKDQKRIQQPQLPTEVYDDNRTKGLKLFKTYCASCHGFDGLGLKNMAPSFADSDIIQNRFHELPKIILDGYDSGSNKYQMMMPKYLNDPSLDDNDISDLVSYISSSFSKNGGGISASQVKMLRNELTNSN